MLKQIKIKFDTQSTSSVYNGKCMNHMKNLDHELKHQEPL